MTTTTIENVPHLTADEQAMIRSIARTDYGHLGNAADQIRAWVGRDWFVYEGGSHLALHRTQDGPRVLIVAEIPIATQIGSWRDDLRSVRSAPRSFVAVLVYCYNWSTCPSRPMTDREHHACRRLARWCMTRLTGRAGWYESDSGRLCVKGSI